MPRPLAGLAAALAVNVAVPASLSAAPVHHRSAGRAAPAASKNAPEEQSAESCWKMTDSDHDYGYAVPCSEKGAMQHR